MLTETERKLLMAALGLEWHEVLDYCCSCGDCFNETARVDYLGRTIDTHLLQNRTFIHAQDYEDLLEKVVRPNLDDFSFWLFMENEGPRKTIIWFLTLSIEERCKLIHDFGVEVLGWCRTK